ncbi:MAG TPA: ornithine carbamoyltransferase [Aggregatilineales bacterium]|nr:ornithine carbamoyltransferase [Aggregatilineales bacterium]
MPQHFIKVRDVSADAFNHMIDKSIEIKRDPAPWHDSMRNQTLAMIFQKTSTRTRFSFEAGMTELGGHAIFAQTQHTQMGIADIADEGKVISRYAALIMARMMFNRDLIALAEGSEVPVINGCDDRYHPAQALTDLMTIKEHFGRTEGLKIVYLGVANNVSNSLSMASVYAGANFTLCVPEFDPPAVDEEQLEMLRANPLYEEVADPVEAVQGADVLYTDTWINMEHFTNPDYADEKARRIDLLSPYQINEELLARTGKDSTIVMHCLPAHKGYEVNETVLYHPNSVIFDQAENRLHAQKALMLWLVDKI